MHPSQSMNTTSGPVDLDGRLQQARLRSRPLTFMPRNGVAPLPAWALKDVGDGWWDIIVEDTSADPGTPHRIFETRSRPAGPFDVDVLGLYHLGTPALAREAAGRDVGEIEARALYDSARTGTVDGNIPGAFVPGPADAPAQPAGGNPLKLFYRATFCAVIQAEKTHPQTEESLATLNRLLSIYQNME